MLILLWINAWNKSPSFYPNTSILNAKSEGTACVLPQPAELLLREDLLMKALVKWSLTKAQVANQKQ